MSVGHHRKKKWKQRGRQEEQAHTTQTDDTCDVCLSQREGVSPVFISEKKFRKKEKKREVSQRYSPGDFPKWLEVDGRKRLNPRGWQLVLVHQ